MRHFRPSRKPTKAKKKGCEKKRSRDWTPKFQYRVTLASGKTWFFRDEQEAIKFEFRSNQSFYQNRARRKRRSRANQVIAEFAADPENRTWKVNDSEAAFVGFMERGRPGYTILRSGWPDFLVRDTDNKVCAVEVKKHPDTLRQNQIECIKALELGGIPSYVFRVEKGDIVSWREFIREKQEAMAAHKHRQSVLRKAPQTSVERVSTNPDGSAITAERPRGGRNG